MPEDAKVINMIKQYLIDSGAITEEGRITEVTAPSTGARKETRPIIRIRSDKSYICDFIVYPTTQYITVADMAILERPTTAEAYRVNLTDDKTEIERVRLDPPLHKGAKFGWICYIISSGNPDAAHNVEKVLTYAADPEFVRKEIILKAGGR